MSGHLELPGIWNLRDLVGHGGLGEGVLLRSDSPHRLSAASWQVLAERGVATVIDLRTSAEAAVAFAHGPLVRVHVPLEEGLQDGPLMQSWLQDGRIATPLYYAPFTQTWPERVSQALSAIVSAEGGALVHCKKGCDRTGMIVALILEALDTPREAIVRDYLRTVENVVGPAARDLGIPDDTEPIKAVLARQKTTYEEALNSYLDGVAEFLAPHREPLRRKLLDSP